MNSFEKKTGRLHNLHTILSNIPFGNDWIMRRSIADITDIQLTKQLEELDFASMTSAFYHINYNTLRQNKLAIEA